VLKSLKPIRLPPKRAPSGLGHLLLVQRSVARSHLDAGQMEQQWNNKWKGSVAA